MTKNTHPNQILRLELINNLLLFFDVEFTNLFRLLDELDSKQQIVVIERLKELNEIVYNLKQKSRNAKFKRI